MKQPKLVWKKFTGLNNKSRPEELDNNELSVARNIDVNNRNRLSRRYGQTIFSNLTGPWYSIWSDDDTICLAIKGGDLYRIKDDFSGANLIRSSVGNGRMSYTIKRNTVYYTNGLVIGQIVNGSDIPFKTPTANYKSIIPAGQLLDLYNNRLWVAKDNVLWFSDVLSFGQVDMRNGFKQFKSYINMVKSVDSGIYVSDLNATYFMSGSSPNKMKLKDVAGPVIPGFFDVIDGSKIRSNFNGKVVLFATQDSIYYGLSDGTVIPITEKVFKIPLSTNAATLIREKPDSLQLIGRLYNG